MCLTDMLTKMVADIDSPSLTCHRQFVMNTNRYKKEIFNFITHQSTVHTSGMSFELKLSFKVWFPLMPEFAKLNARLLQVKIIIEILNTH